MNWYKLAKLNKIATLSFYIKDYKRDRNFDNIHSLSWNLSTMLFNKWLDNYDKAYFAEHHQVPSSDTITIDGFDVDALVGTINFYIEGIPSQKVQDILNNIRQYLETNGVRLGKFVQNTSRMYKVPVVRIPILENKKGEQAMNEDKPPELNMANGNAFFIFNTVLKYDKDLWDDGSFDPNEVIRRINYFEGETALPEGSHAGQGAIQISFEDLQNADFIGGRSGQSTYTESDVRYRLNQIKQFCQWAVDHGYSEIYVA